MSGIIDLKNPSRAVRCGVILMNGITEILDVAPIDVLHGMCAEFNKDWPEEFLPASLKKQSLDMEFIWVSEHGSAKGPMRMTSNLNIVATHSFADCPTLDVVIIGAHHVGYKPNEAELAFVRRMHETCAAFISVCAGVEVPLLAGLLVGKTATGPRPMVPMLRQQAPQTNWVEKRWVRDGKMWTSGALLNGLDLIHEFAAATWGGEGTLMDYLLKGGAVPSRDVDYKDVAWTF
ncbi:hypothetical protein RB594_001028 [Gaeumannomyces avenae]